MNLKTYLQNVQARLENATPSSSELLKEARKHLKERRQLISDSWTRAEVNTFELGYRRGVISKTTDLSTLLQIVKIQNDALKKYSDSAFEIEGNIYKIGSVADKAIQQVETLLKGE